ncbi:MAG: metalloregulator ArsR/SmtB family transcription factor [bacterium]|nr:metalloregulator ArsR/SmtB family transcription factor [bacterium]
MKKKQIAFEKLQDHYVARAEIIKALAHPTRLFIIDRLSEREHCVCELTDMIGADTSTVSKHLSVMKNAGIVSSDKRGLQVWYSLKVPCILNFFGCIEETIRQGAREHMDLAKSGKC